MVADDPPGIGFPGRDGTPPAMTPAVSVPGDKPHLLLCSVALRAPSLAKCGSKASSFPPGHSSARSLPAVARGKPHSFHLRRYYCPPLPPHTGHNLPNRFLRLSPARSVIHRQSYALTSLHSWFENQRFSSLPEPSVLPTSRKALRAFRTTPLVQTSRVLRASGAHSSCADRPDRNCKPLHPPTLDSPAGRPVARFYSRRPNARR